MSTDLATLAIVVDGDKATRSIKNFSHAAAESRGIAHEFTEELEGIEKGFAKARVVLGLGLFGFEFAKSAIAAQNSMAQLEAGIRSTGGAAGFMSSQLREQAFELESVSTFTHTAIEQTQAILLLYEKLSGVNFERATKSAADLATRLGTGVPEAARMLGRALEEPEVGTESLRRAGVTFSAGQITVIKSLVQTGQTAKAQGIILDELETKLRGSAEAARDTLGGALLGVSHAFENLFEVSEGGSNDLIITLNDISKGLDDLREHSKVLTTIGAVVGGGFLARNLATIAEYGNRLIETAKSAAVAAKAEVARTGALVQSTLAEADRVAWDVRLAESTRATAASNSAAATSIAAQTAATEALVAADAQLVIAKEAALAVTIELTDAQLAETESLVVLGRTATVTGVLMTRAGALGAAAWKLMGGWIGLTIAGAVAANALLNRYINKRQEAAEQTKEQSDATDRALVIERRRNAQIRQSAEDEATAAVAAAKANTERDATTAKLNGLNRAYMDSATALKIRDIELSANIEKAKAHKEVLQLEWAAIDKSIDALTRQKVAQIELEQVKSSKEDLTALSATNDANVIAARNAGALATATVSVAEAQLVNADASLKAQGALARLQNQMDAATHGQEAWVAFKRQIVGATDAEIASAKTLYDATISGIGATLEQKNANVSANTEIQRSIRLLQDAAKSQVDLTSAHAHSAASTKSVQDSRELAIAEDSVTRARFLGGVAVSNAQNKLEHLRNALNAENEVTAAGVTLKAASVSATKEQIAAATALYNETIRGIGAVKQATDANIDALTETDRLDDARNGTLGVVQDFFASAQQGSTSFWNHFVSTAEQAFANLIEKHLIDKVLSSSSVVAALSGAPNGSLSNVSPAELKDIFTLPSASQSRAAKISEGVGVATAGFGVGHMIGGMTTSKTVGALGGALGGAATGAGIGALGGPLGAVAGGIIGAATGFIGGLLGTKKAVTDFGERLFGVASGFLQAHQSLADWRAQVTGDSKDIAEANKADLRWKYLSIVQTIEQVESGKKQEHQRNIDLKEAADIYALAQGKLTDSTNTLNTAFSSMIGEVSGYHLNLDLFKFSPALGPTAPAPAQKTASTGNSSSSGASERTGNEPASFDRSPIIVQLHVDGKMLASATVDQYRKVASANFGSSDKILEAMKII